VSKRKQASRWGTKAIAGSIALCMVAALFLALPAAVLAGTAEGTATASPAEILRKIEDLVQKIKAEIKQILTDAGANLQQDPATVEAIVGDAIAKVEAAIDQAMLDLETVLAEAEETSGVPGIEGPETDDDADDLAVDPNLPPVAEDDADCNDVPGVPCADDPAVDPNLPPVAEDDADCNDVPGVPCPDDSAVDDDDPASPVVPPAQSSSRSGRVR
jgi:hypothetical protein